MPLRGKGGYALVMNAAPITTPALERELHAHQTTARHLAAVALKDRPADLALADAAWDAGATWTANGSHYYLRTPEQHWILSINAHDLTVRRGPAADEVGTPAPAPAPSHDTIPTLTRAQFRALRERGEIRTRYAFIGADASSLAVVGQSYAHDLRTATGQQLAYQRHQSIYTARLVAARSGAKFFVSDH